MSDLLTAKEAAEVLRVSVHTLYRLVRSGALPAVRITDGGVIRISESDLQNWIRKHKRGDV